MTPPHPPNAVPASPEVAHHEHAAAVLPQHRRRHPHSLDDGGTITVNVDHPVVHLVLVHDVVREDLEPSLARHDGVGRMHEHQRVVIVEDLACAFRIP